MSSCLITNYSLFNVITNNKKHWSSFSSCGKNRSVQLETQEKNILVLCRRGYLVQSRQSFSASAPVLHSISSDPIMIIIVDKFDDVNVSSIRFIRKQRRMKNKRKKSRWSIFRSINIDGDNLFESDIDKHSFLFQSYLLSTLTVDDKTHTKSYWQVQRCFSFFSLLFKIEQRKVTSVRLALFNWRDPLKSGRWAVC